MTPPTDTQVIDFANLDRDRHNCASKRWISAGNTARYSEDEDADSGECDSDNDSNGSFNWRWRANADFIDFEREMEEQVTEAHRNLRKVSAIGRKIPVGEIADGRWDLYSSTFYPQYLGDDFLYDDLKSKVVFFGKFSNCERGQMAAKIRLAADPDIDLDMLPFEVPKEASLDPITLASNDAFEKEVKIWFLGQGCLRMEIDLAEYFEDGYRPRDGMPTPEKIVWSGIFTSREERKLELRELKRREASPTSVSSSSHDE